ncbi:MAG TPA: phosphate acyltransferase PlsX [Gammaproteobacteria bacterium]
MNAKTIIALDAMSGDRGPEAVVSAAAFTVKEYSNVQLILVGDQAMLETLVNKKSLAPAQRQRLSIQHASQVVTMEDPPAQALRSKKDSSMRVAIDLVKQGKAQACVSAGNTGALMATARFVLKMISGIDRPAICSALPAMQGHTFMMDLGANVDCTSEHLYQFALMGSVLVKALDAVESPRIGLLNIGSEEIKGNDVVKQASQLLANSSLNYIGYVEGNDIFNNKADVVVADGFTGNVALKSAEGLAHMISAYLRSEFKRNPLTLVAGLVSLPVLQSFKRRIDPRRYNGATLLGLQGIVIKSHGSADKLAFANAIKIAMLEVEHNVIAVIDKQINALEASQGNT